MNISIIVPVYNAAPFLPRCLDSILCQTHTHLEIILINDGSTDSSGQICDDYAKKDNRICVFHKENGGDASARNAGLSQATGAYIGFVDADDWIEPDMYDVMLQALNTYPGASVCVVNYFKDTENNQTSMINNNEIPQGLLSTKNMMRYALDRDNYMGFCSYVWNKLYDANIIANIRCYETLKFGSDVLFFADSIVPFNCKGVFVNKPLYHYYQRGDSLANATSFEQRCHIMKAYKQIEVLLNNYGYDNLVFWARGFYCHHAAMALEKAVENKDEKNVLSMQAEIRQHLDDYVKTNPARSKKLKRINYLLNM